MHIHLKVITALTISILSFQLEGMDNDSNISDQKIDLKALAKLQRTSKSSPSHETILKALSQTVIQKTFEYRKKNLTPLWKPLKQLVKKDNINNLLMLCFTDTQDSQDYWQRKRLIIAALIHAGADPNQKNRDQLTILGEAVLFCDISAATLLLKHGANPNVAMANYFQAPIIWYANSDSMRTLLLKYNAYVPSIPHTSSSDAAELQNLLQLATDYDNTTDGH